MRSGKALQQKFSHQSRSVTTSLSQLKFSLDLFEKMKKEFIPQKDSLIQSILNIFKSTMLCV